MSVIVRDEEGKILLLCKGADRYVAIYLKNPETSTFSSIEKNPIIFSFFYAVSCLTGLPKMVGISKLRPGTM